MPKWLEYPQAIKKGDLFIPKKPFFEINKTTKNSIKNDLLEFNINASPQMACRLMGAGIVIGDEQLARDMASFITNHRGVDELSIKLADKILGGNSNVERVSEIDVRISSLKKWVSEYPNSAISWIELSRAYTIKGQDEKAIKAAKIALQLAPWDRYIVRCGVRLFLHVSDFDMAWHYINRASKHHFDPWIKATEVNVALISGNKVPDIRKVIPANLVGEQLFHYSELLESSGYLELDSGNDKKAKKHLRLAWTKPSENVITHAEWLLRNKIPWMRETAALEFDRSHEATTWINYCELNLDKAIESALEWELEEPYSKYPYLVGSSIACNAGKPDVGAAIANRGLKIDPHDRTLNNNLCYSLLRAGNVDQAGKYINRLKKEADLDLYCQATVGLYEFKNMNFAEGRKAYNSVIDKFKQRGMHVLRGNAFLNLALAELDSCTAQAKDTAIKSLEETEKIRNLSDIILMRKLVQEKLNLLVQG